MKVYHVELLKDFRIIDVGQRVTATLVEVCVRLLGFQQIPGLVATLDKLALEQQEANNSVIK